MNKATVLKEIKSFLEGYDNDFKYLVNVEIDTSTNVADCVIHEPNQPPKIVKKYYEPFMYMKDLSKEGRSLFAGHTEEYVHSMGVKHGIKITKLKTGNQKRLVKGYCYKITSSKSQRDIYQYLMNGGLNPYEKAVDAMGDVIRDVKGAPIYPNRDLFYSVRPVEQFFISTRTRLFKGLEKYKDVHKITFDIETTGLRYQMARVFAIGVRDNRGFEMILEAEKLNDDESEIRLIQDFFNLLYLKKPAVISGYNSENFDFEFLLGRAKILKMDMNALPTSLKAEISMKRRPNTSVKYGNAADKYTATEMWGISVIDIMHAAKKTAAVNTELKSTRLKYVCKFEKIAKPNRTYIKGEDNSISRFYAENKIFVCADDNTYIEMPDEYQDVGVRMYKLQGNKSRITKAEYNLTKKEILDENKEFVDWFREVALPKGMNKFISGKKLLRQYLLDDLWETEQVDELYNQSSFMLGKIVPTTYQRVCTMGTAAIWNLLLTAWSYENDLAIPISDVKEKFSGGLARCYKVGYSERIKKIDFSSLYPMIQLEDDVFPIFDITGVIKKMLLYLTTTRNIYKRIGGGAELHEEEVMLLKEIDHMMYEKYVNNTLTSEDRAMAKVKQLPIKKLNNSLFGALGADVSFNWSDNVCAARITCSGRIHLRHAIKWFSDYGCEALLAVTDGVNFRYPEVTNIRITDNGVTFEDEYRPIEDMWSYGGKIAMDALIEKFNKEEMRTPYMSVDDDGDAVSSLNLSRINYANLVLNKDKKTGEMKEKVKLTGNTIKSKTMPEYVEEFIDKGLDLILHGKGSEFVEYYYDYCEDIRYMQIPLKKIASKSKVKMKLDSYLKRGTDKNDKEKAKQAHMELLIQKRERIALELFEKNRESLTLPKKKNLTLKDKMKAVSDYMPPEPELDSVVYYYNTGNVKSHGDSKEIPVLDENGKKVPVLDDAGNVVLDKNGKKVYEMRYASTIIDNKDLSDNPDMKGGDDNEKYENYNYAKYLAAFNSRVKSILVGFDENVQKKIITKINKQGDLVKHMFKPEELELKSFKNDDFDESMYLEDLEVDFWNKTGYDPRILWDGFKMRDDKKVYYEIYESALNHLNGLMEKSGKPMIKSINESYDKDDLVLIKDGGEYQIGVFNGTYLQIIRDSVEIPKSEIEIELDRKREEQLKKIEQLCENELAMSGITEQMEAALRKREEYFPLFLKSRGLSPNSYTIDILDNPELAKMAEAFDEFIEDMESANDNEAAEYGGYDEIDGAY